MTQTLQVELMLLRERMASWRRDFHMYPEIAFEEVRTSQKIEALLKGFGLEVTENIAKTGVVGTLRTGEGPTISLRSDIDALPIREQNTFAHASRHPGFMHACGHDGHMAMLLGAACFLAETKKFQGTVHFIFQPAEENEAGAKAMIDDGLFDRFNCDAVFGLHNWPGLEVGRMEVCEGPIMASFDVFDIVVTAQGAHAAMPHLGQDAVLTGSELTMALQSIVSRRINPISPAVVSVTAISGGDTYNVLPSNIRLKGCTRHFDPKTQDLVEFEFQRICDGISKANGVEIALDYKRRYPATVNTGPETLLSGIAARRTVGDANFHATAEPSLSSEDFAFMLNERPGCYIRLGNGAATNGRTLHSPTYDFCDEALVIGASYWSNLVSTVLEELRR